MEDLEYDLLNVWREDTADIRAKIGGIADVLSKHLSFEKAEHDDLMDLATHLKLANALNVPKSTIKASKKREPVPETPPLAGSVQHRSRQKQHQSKTHPAHFFNPDSVLETAYIVGSEINYYGCDTTSCVNV